MKRKAIANIRTIRESIEIAKQKLEKAERDYSLERAAELKHGTLPGLEKQLKNAENKLNKESKENRLLKEEVTEEEYS